MPRRRWAILDISRANPLPLHHQLRQTLEEQIRAGLWAAGTAIPTEYELMERYGVSRTTVRQALAALVADGILYRQQGKGTFVAPRRIAQPLDSLEGWIESLLQQGLHPQVHLMALTTAAGTPEICQRLEVAAGAPLLLLERRVDVGDEPLFWDRSWLPAHLGLRPDPQTLLSRPLFRWLEASGLPPAEASLTLSARPATPAEAAVLRLPAGGAVLDIQRTVYTTGGRPLLDSRVVYRSDRYQYQIRLTRRAGAAALPTP